MLIAGHKYKLLVNDDDSGVLVGLPVAGVIVVLLPAGVIIELPAALG